MSIYCDMPSERSYLIHLFNFSIIKISKRDKKINIWMVMDNLNYTVYWNIRGSAFALFIKKLKISCEQIRSCTSIVTTTRTFYWQVPLYNIAQRHVILWTLSKKKPFDLPIIHSSPVLLCNLFMNLSFCAFSYHPQIYLQKMVVLEGMIMCEGRVSELRVFF